MIAVVGGGHGGHCMAADLTLAGHAVVFCGHPGASGAFLDTLRLGRIELTGHGRTGVAAPRAITDDLAETLRGARLVHVVLPAMRQRELFEAMGPHLRDDHRVVVWSGYFGALRLDAWLRQRGGPRPLIGETSTIPYSTRISGPGHVHVQALAVAVLLAALPATDTAELFAACASLWPGVLRRGEQVLQTSFSNPNLLAHSVPVVLNLGRIEYSGGEFYIYKEGITPSVARAMRALFAELQAVAAAYDFAPWPFAPDDFAPPTSVVSAIFRGPHSVDELSRSRGPSGVEHRFLTEDLPYGLAPIGRLARLAGIVTPVLDGVLALGAAAAGRDFQAEGPSAEALGLAGMGVADIANHVRGPERL